MKSPIGWNNGLRTKEILRCIYCVSTAYLCAHVYVYAHVCAFMQKPKEKKNPPPTSSNSFLVLLFCLFETGSHIEPEAYLFP